VEGVVFLLLLKAVLLLWLVPTVVSVIGLLAVMGAQRVSRGPAFLRRRPARGRQTVARTRRAGQVPQS
jgi:cytochrome c-type biogenesis protein CcmH/NrfF